MSEHAFRHDRTVTIDVQFVLGVTEHVDTDASETPTDDDYEAWLASRLEDIHHDNEVAGHPAIDSIEIEAIGVGPTLRHTPGELY